MNRISIVVICMNLIGIVIMLGLAIVTVERDKTVLAATRAIGIQCNKYHAYGDKIDKLKTYSETYNDN